MPGDITEIGVQSICFSAIKCAAQWPTMRTAECFCRLRALAHDRAANANVSQTPATHTKRNCSFLHVTFRLSSQRCVADALRTPQLSSCVDLRCNLEQSSQCACGSNAWLAHARATWQYKLHSTAPPSHDQRKRIALDHGLATCSHSWQRTRIDEWDDTRSAPNAAARYIRLGLTHLTLPTECLNPSRAPLARPPQPRPRINHKWLARAFQPQAGMS